MSVDPRHPDPRTTDVVTRFLLPYPIAALYQLRRTCHTERDRLDRSLRLVEGIIRFLAFVALADAIDRTSDAKQRREWLAHLNNSGPGKLGLLWKESIQFLAAFPDPFVPEMAPLVDSSWERALDVIIDGRNDFVHRDDVRSEGDARRVLRELDDALRTVLNGVQFLRDYQLGVVQGMRGTGETRSYYWYSSRGTEEQAESIELKGRGDLATDVALLVHPSRQRALLLEPFLHWGASAAQTGDHFWWINRIQTEKGEEPRVVYSHPTLRGTPDVEPAGTFSSPDPTISRGLERQEFVARVGEWKRRFDLHLEPDAAARIMDPPTPPSVGERFRVIGLLGRGAMGSVWEAEDTELNRACALKTPYRDHLRDSSSRRRFSREGELLRTLKHAGLPEVFQAGMGPGEQPFIAMELVTGPTLDQQLRGVGPLEPARAVRIVDEVLDALAAIHARGVVHRDVKPANVVLATERAKLIDFGIALPAGATRHTRWSETMGTPGFMAPEQSKGDADARSDLYSVGQLLFAALAGRPRLAADETFASLGRDVPRAIERVCIRALQEKPEERFSSAQDMRAALARALADPDDRSTDPPPAVSAAGRTRSAVWGGIAVTAISALAAAGVWIGLDRATSSPSTSPPRSTAMASNAMSSSRAPCTAHSDPRWDFHLRLRAECHGGERPYSEGVTWDFDVLGDAPFTRHGQRLYRVRVVQTGQEGFVFMRPDELHGDCSSYGRPPIDATECR